MALSAYSEDNSPKIETGHLSGEREHYKGVEKLYYTHPAEQRIRKITAISTSWFWILLTSSSTESSVAVGWTFPAVNRPQNELKFTKLSAAK
ncbi:hypothetical protein AV530_015516 [Patagioenas fasciata monilis]|uniref:Uncharacterized protein n=1 Tax=Patagioenas fasciata monilis TaxID=372326 RepID=A0A1V4KRV5_PATFA|nr:hypothetical protein AV530_015516 [Patagioenas fasciata monilis]